jgi:hypothetical protein
MGPAFEDGERPHTCYRCAQKARLWMHYDELAVRELEAAHRLFPQTPAMDSPASIAVQEKSTARWGPYQVEGHCGICFLPIGDAGLWHVQIGLEGPSYVSVERRDVCADCAEKYRRQLGIMRGAMADPRLDDPRRSFPK